MDLRNENEISMAEVASDDEDIHFGREFDKLKTSDDDGEGIDDLYEYWEE